MQDGSILVKVNMEKSEQRGPLCMDYGGRRSCCRDSSPVILIFWTMNS